MLREKAKIHAFSPTYALTATTCAIAFVVVGSAHHFCKARPKFLSLQANHESFSTSYQLISADGYYLVLT